MDVFVSHIHEEARIASVLNQWVESTFAGQTSVFVSSDSADIGPGTKWFSTIERELGSARALIVLCSPRSIGRSWINFETGCAWIKGIPVIPLCHSGLKPSDLAPPLSLTQGLDLSDDKCAEELIRALATIFKISQLPKIDYTEMLRELRQAVPLGGSYLPSYCPVRSRLALPTMSEWDVAVRAQDILFVGHNLNLVLRQKSFFELKLSQDHTTMRFLIVNPSNHLLIDFLSQGVLEHEYTKSDFGPAQDAVRSLRMSLPSDQATRVDVKVLDYVPTLSFQVIDGKTPRGTILVELTPNRIAVPDRPHFVLNADNPAHRDWYESFRQNCERMWEEATPFSWRDA